MEITVNKKIKVAEIWLTNEEQENQQIRDKVSEIIQNYNKTKFRTVVFCSGKKDLLSCTESLLKNNLQ